jgi:hypothetical protein
LDALKRNWLWRREHAWQLTNATAQSRSNAWELCVKASHSNRPNVVSGSQLSRRELGWRFRCPRIIPRMAKRSHGWGAAGAGGSAAKDDSAQCESAPGRFIRPEREALQLRRLLACTHRLPLTRPRRPSCSLLW